MSRATYAKQTGAASTDGLMENLQGFRSQVTSGKQPRLWYSNLMGGTWTPTIINPSSGGGVVDRVLFIFHLLVWVVALVLTTVANFGVSNGTFKDETDPAHHHEFSDGTKTVATFSGICCILGVLGIIASSAIYDTELYKSATITNTAIHFLLNYSLAGSFFIFARAAGIKQDGGLYTVSLFGMIFHTYASVLFYSCSAALETLALPRAFIPTLTVSVQFINFLEINDGSFLCRTLDMDENSMHNPSLISAASACTDEQKSVAMLIPLFTLIGLVSMIATRKMFRTDEGGRVMNAPFTRSIALTLFLASGILSIYKYTFMSGNVIDNVAGMFGMFGMLLQFTIIGIAFMPSGEPSGGATPAASL